MVGDGGIAFRSEALRRESAWWNFCECWWEKFGKKKVRASDLLDLARGAGIAVEWAEVGTFGVGRSDEIRLGMELHRHLDRRFGIDDRIGFGHAHRLTFVRVPNDWLLHAQR